MMKNILLLFFIVSISYTSVQADMLSAEEFRRDFIKVGFTSWLAANNAELIEKKDPIPTHFGTREDFRFRANSGNVNLEIYRDTEGLIYDIIRLPNEDISFKNDYVRQILYRILWVLETRDSTYLNSFFSLHKAGIHFYFGQPGGLDAQIKAFENQTRNRNWIPLSWVFSEQEDGSYNFEAEVFGEQLRIEIQPSLHLLLNGQVDVLTARVRDIIKEGNSMNFMEYSGTYQAVGNTAVVPFFGRQEEAQTINYKLSSSEKKLRDLAWNTDALEAYVTYKWLAWHLPATYNVSTGISKASEIAIQLDGDQIYSFSDVAADHVSQIGPILGDQKVVVFVVDDISMNEESAEVRMHIRYVDETLQYVHAVRIRESYRKSDSAISLSDTKIDLILSIRMDNVSQIYGTKRSESKEPLFQIRVQND